MAGGSAEGGGRIVATGTPEEVAAVASSHTGTALRAGAPGGPGRVAGKEVTAAVS